MKKPGPAIPKPINLPSRRAENHGFDPTISLVQGGNWSASKPPGGGQAVLSAAARPAAPAAATQAASDSASSAGAAPWAAGGGGAPHAHAQAQASAGMAGQRPAAGLSNTSSFPSLTGLTFRPAAFCRHPCSHHMDPQLFVALLKPSRRHPVTLPTIALPSPLPCPFAASASLHRPPLLSPSHLQA